MPFTATRDGDDMFGAAYEALRRSVLAGASAGGPGGLVLLQREGLAAWMTSGAVSAAPVEAAQRGAAPVLANEVDASVVQVLASMALGRLKEMRA